jgi:hypothetical protein
MKHIIAAEGTTWGCQVFNVLASSAIEIQHTQYRLVPVVGTGTLEATLALWDQHITIVYFGKSLYLRWDLSVQLLVFVLLMKAVGVILAHVARRQFMPAGQGEKTPSSSQ